MAPQLRLVIDVASQGLFVLEQDANETVLRRRYPVSTAARGCGQQFGSECTPLGRHIVRARIGAGLPAGSVLVARRPTGEVFTPALARKHPDRDWILSRILWLSGTEIGHNRLGSVDTMRRFIYLHGTPDATRLGRPGSKGCIRMTNRDIIELFDVVPSGTPVEIREKGGWR